MPYLNVQGNGTAALIVNKNASVDINSLATTRSLNDCTMKMPIDIKQGGLVTLESSTGLSLYANNYNSFALQDNGTMKVGTKNQNDTKDGNTSVGCYNKGSVVGNVNAGLLDVFGDTNYWADLNAAGGLELGIAANGTLNLDSSTGSFENTTLTITNDGRVASNITFYAGSTFSFGLGTGSVDHCTLKVNGGNCTIDDTCVINPTRFAANSQDWGAVVQVSGSEGGVNNALTGTGKKPTGPPGTWDLFNNDGLNLFIGWHS